MADLDDVRALDWGDGELPEDFQPLEAIILVKGVYVTDDGDLTRPTWMFRWTRSIADNPTERLGALDIATTLVRQEAISGYTEEL